MSSFTHTFRVWWKEGFASVKQVTTACLRYSLRWLDHYQIRCAPWAMPPAMLMFWLFKFRFVWPAPWRREGCWIHPTFCNSGRLHNHHSFGVLRNLEEEPGGRGPLPPSSESSFVNHPVGYPHDFFPGIMPFPCDEVLIFHERVHFSTFYHCSWSLLTNHFFSWSWIHFFSLLLTWHLLFADLSVVNRCWFRISCQGFTVMFLLSEHPIFFNQACQFSNICTAK